MQKEEIMIYMRLEACLLDLHNRNKEKNLSANIEGSYKRTKHHEDHYFSQSEGVYNSNHNNDYYQPSLRHHHRPRNQTYPRILK